jgi:hypothetical protein
MTKEEIEQLRKKDELVEQIKQTQEKIATISDSAEVMRLKTQIKNYHLQLTEIHKIWFELLERSEAGLDRSLKLQTEIRSLEEIAAEKENLAILQSSIGAGNEGV